MNKKIDFKTINEIIGCNDSFKMPQILMEKLFYRNERERIFREFLQIEHNLDYDWFHIYFQEEYAERKTMKQDFTPDSIGLLLSKIINDEALDGSGATLDVAGGTGGLTIQKWVQDKYATKFFDYKPSNYFYQVEELSDRALPFLLFNLAIRGMNAVVIHGDALHREVHQIYLLENEFDRYTSFSTISIFKHTKQVEKEFNVQKWLSEEIDYVESNPLYFMKGAMLNG